MDERRRLTKWEAKRSEKVSWSVLPSEVEENILSRLPATYLMRFRCVCKNWCNLITQPHFVKMQLNRSALTQEGSRLAFRYFGKLFSIDVKAYGKTYVEDRENKKNYLQMKDLDSPFTNRCQFIRISGSCNGLLSIFVIDSFIDSLYLLNPVTKEIKKLPYLEILAGRTPNHKMVFGFGYSPRTDEYKVVVIRYNMVEQSAPSDVCVYTLGTNSSWRSIRGTEYMILEHHHAIVNGALCWIARGMPGFSMVAISFDLADENFREFSLPKSIGQEDIYVELVELGGLLSLFHCKADENFCMWVMKDYGDEQSWTKQFSLAVSMFPRLKYSRPISILKKDEVILFEGNGFSILDLVKKEFFPIQHFRDPKAPYGGMEMYMESLVSLRGDDGIDGSTKQFGCEREQKSEVVPSKNLCI